MTKAGLQEPNKGSRWVKSGGDVELPCQVARQQVGRADMLILSVQVSK